MKITESCTHRLHRAFTLVELLVVIAIIAVLAAMLMPAIAHMRLKAQISQAKSEMTLIADAINRYYTTYNRYPCSTNALNAAVAQKADLTFGYDNPDDVNYRAENQEVIAILMDMERYPLGGDTPNKGHVKNLQRIKFLNATTSTATNDPGVGPDGIYRDPWGTPYIITMDLNFDEKCWDAFHRKNSVSQQTATAGHNGLVSSPPPGVALGTPDYFAYNGPVMVWSRGPDKTVNPFVRANMDKNKDNVLNWKR